MATAYDLNGNPVTGESAPAYDLNGNPVSSKPVPGPGKGGMKPGGVVTVQAPDPETLAPMGRFAGGVDQMLNLGGNRPDQKLRGLHNAFVGGSEIAAPLAIPALVASPAATIGAGLAGGAGKVLGTEIPKYFGASPETSDVIGDAASIPSAMIGGATGETVGPAVGRVLARGIPPALSDFVGMIHPHAGFVMRSAGRIMEALNPSEKPLSAPSSPPRSVGVSPAPLPTPIAPLAPSRSVSVTTPNPPTPIPITPQRSVGVFPGNGPEPLPAPSRSVGVYTGTPQPPAPPVRSIGVFSGPQQAPDAATVKAPIAPPPVEPLATPKAATAEKPTFANGGIKNNVRRR